MQPDDLFFENFENAKYMIEQMKSEIIEIENQKNTFFIEYNEIQNKIIECNNKSSILLKKIKQIEEYMEREYLFESVKHIDGFNNLSKEELLNISNGMDKTNYRKLSSDNLPRWIDLEYIVKKIIEFKKLYPGWTLDSIQKNRNHEPNTCYKFIFKTPHGHYITCVGY
jgi:hypothetical protein